MSLQDGLKAWDTDTNGRVSYEELRRGVNGAIPPLTLKQAFKQVDNDKDLHLSRSEYANLVTQLEQSNVSSSTILIRSRRSDDPRALFDDEDDARRSRLLSKRNFPKGYYSAGDRKNHRRVPRAETAPPLLSPENLAVDKYGDLMQDWKRISSRGGSGTMGGGRRPEEIELVTVNYDDPDFHRKKKI